MIVYKSSDHYLVEAEVALNKSRTWSKLAAGLFLASLVNLAMVIFAKPLPFAVFAFLFFFFSVASAAYSHELAADASKLAQKARYTEKEN